MANAMNLILMLIWPSAKCAQLLHAEQFSIFIGFHIRVGFFALIEC